MRVIVATATLILQRASRNLGAGQVMKKKPTDFSVDQHRAVQDRKPSEGSKLLVGMPSLVGQRSTLQPDPRAGIDLSKAAAGCERA